MNAVTSDITTENVERRDSLAGRRFGSWTVLGLAAGNKPKVVYWLCRCDCGTEKKVYAGNLSAGRSTSCGCDRTKVLVARNTTHGESGQDKSREYRIWEGMIQRCTNSKHRFWSLYGGRGIAVCPRWLKFENFLADMDRSPTSTHSIDRYPNNGGNYEPGNCRWATPQEQRRNQSRYIGRRK